MEARRSQIIRAADYASALAIVKCDPDRFVEVFVARWSDVDEHRADAATQGLAGHISIHHHSALDALVDLHIVPGPPSGLGSPCSASLVRKLNVFIHAAAASLAARLTVVLSH